MVSRNYKYGKIYFFARTVILGIPRVEIMLIFMVYDMYFFKKITVVLVCYFIAS